MLREQLKNPGGGKRVRLDNTNSILHHPTTVPTEIKVPTSEETYTNLVSELFPQVPKLGDVFTIPQAQVVPGSQAPPPSVQGATEISIQIQYSVDIRNINT